MGRPPYLTLRTRASTRCYHPPCLYNTWARHRVSRQMVVRCRLRLGTISLEAPRWQRARLEGWRGMQWCSMAGMQPDVTLCERRHACTGHIFRKAHVVADWRPCRPFLPVISCTSPRRPHIVLLTLFPIHSCPSYLHFDVSPLCCTSSSLTSPSLTHSLDSPRPCTAAPSLDAT